MLAKERRNRITEMLHRDGAVTAAALIKRLGVSPETVRRDLMLMEKEGLLSRVHGGAVEVGEMKSYRSLTRRNEEHSAEKRELAEAAAALVSEGDIIGIDAGSTAVLLAEVLRDRFARLTVVTYSLDVFSILSEKSDFTVILCGGFFLKEEKAFYGSPACDMLDSLHVQKVFICPSAVSLQNGIADYQTELFEMQKKLQMCGDRIFILADSSKFEKKALLRLDIMRPEYTYVTDSGLAEELQKLYEENGITIYAGIGGKK